MPPAATPAAVAKLAATTTTTRSRPSRKPSEAAVSSPNASESSARDWSHKARPPARTSGAVVPSTGQPRPERLPINQAMIVSSFSSFQNMSSEIRAPMKLLTATPARSSDGIDTCLPIEAIP